MTRKELKDHLEQLVDTHTLSFVLEALSDIALEKSDHIQTNWQDVPLSRAWAKDAKLIANTASKLNN